MKTEAALLNRVRIELGGEFWGPEALSLAERLPISELIGARCVVLSLAKVRRIDEAGLAMLVRLYSQLRVRGSQLEFVDVPSAVLALFERVGFSRLVSCAGGSEAEQVHYSIMLGAQVEA